MYNKLRSKNKKIVVSKMHLPMKKYIESPNEKLEQIPIFIPSKFSSPNIFSPNAKEVFGFDKDDIFAKYKSVED